LKNKKNTANLGACLSFLQVQALRVSLKIFPFQAPVISFSFFYKENFLVEKLASTYPTPFEIAFFFSFFSFGKVLLLRKLKQKRNNEIFKK
jgi:hypothetical protein